MLYRIFWEIELSERIGKHSCPLPNDTGLSGPEGFSVFDKSMYLRWGCSVARTCFWAGICHSLALLPLFRDLEGEERPSSETATALTQSGRRKGYAVIFLCRIQCWNNVINGWRRQKPVN